MIKEIKNKKGKRNFEILEKFEAGIILKGSEIKSIKKSKISFTESSFCYFHKDGLYLKNVHISEYEQSSSFTHDPKRDKKLLLKKNELKKIRKNVSNKGISIIPVRLYVNKKNLAKVEIALAKGLNKKDKREKIKEKDIKRDTEKTIKQTLNKF